MKKDFMIPRTIHYCWFGGKPLTPLARKCIDSWRRFLPTFEIRQWDEDSFDVNAHPYTRDAYRAGKYAFVSDYARFKILYGQGGLYFDTDVEVIRPMDDILEKGPFMGFELDGADGRMAVNPGLGLAAEPGMELFREILEQYDSMSFFAPDGTMDAYTMIPMVTELLARKGLTGNAGIEEVAGIRVYPASWFNPYDDATGQLKKTADTRTIHWYAKSWCPPEAKSRVFLKRMIRRILGTERVSALGNKLKNKR